MRSDESDDIPRGRAFDAGLSLRGSGRISQGQRGLRSSGASMEIFYIAKGKTKCKRKFTAKKPRLHENVQPGRLVS
jgi:hypothetical protein